MTANEAPDMVASAVWYAKNGFKVLPLHTPVEGGCSCGTPACSAVGKHPRTEHGLKDATCDLATVEGWWQEWPEANIGLVTEGMIVVDLDPRNGGPAERSEFIEAFGPIPETAESITGGGGRHLFFRNPGGEGVPAHLATGVDLKGPGGYVVAAPSRHVSGRRYCFDGLSGPKALLTLADPPRWLLAQIRAGAKVSGNGHAGVIGAKIRHGEQHSTLVSIAGSMRARGLGYAEILAALTVANRDRCEVPGPPENIERIARSVCKYEPGKLPRGYTRACEPEPDEADPAAPEKTALIRVDDLPSLFSLDTKPIQWIIDGLLPEASVVMISGDSGSGKSTLATAWGAHIALGVPFAGRGTAQRHVLLLDRENPAAIVKDRLIRLGANDGGGLKIWGGWLDDEAPHPGGAVILEWVARMDPKPVIVTDSAIAFLEGDENSSGDVRRFLHPLRKLSQAGATVLILHHSGKGDSTLDYRGSSDWKAGIDVGYTLANIGDPARFERVRLRAFKARIPVASDSVFDFNEHEAIFTERGSESKHRTDEAICHAVLLEFPGATGKMFEDEAVRRGLGRNKARAILQTWVTTGKVSRASGGRRATLHSISEGAR